MTDETDLEKTLRLIFDNMPAQVEAREFLRDLHAAGYEIVPGWSDDLSKAPRDGTPVLFYAPEYTPPFMVVNCFGETEKHFAVAINAEAVHLADVTHWKPITPPKESE